MECYLNSRVILFLKTHMWSGAVIFKYCVPLMVLFFPTLDFTRDTSAIVAHERWKVSLESNHILRLLFFIQSLSVVRPSDKVCVLWTSLLSRLNCVCSSYFVNFGLRSVKYWLTAVFACSHYQDSSLSAYFLRSTGHAVSIVWQSLIELQLKCR